MIFDVYCEISKFIVPRVAALTKDDGSGIAGESVETLEIPSFRRSITGHCLHPLLPHLFRYPLRSPMVVYTHTILSDPSTIYLPKYLYRYVGAYRTAGKSQYTDGLRYTRKYNIQFPFLQNQYESEQKNSVSN